MLENRFSRPQIGGASLIAQQGNYTLRNAITINVLSFSFPIKRGGKIPPVANNKVMTYTCRYVGVKNLIRFKFIINLHTSSVDFTNTRVAYMYMHISSVYEISISECKNYLYVMYRWAVINHVQVGLIMSPWKLSHIWVLHNL